MTAFSAAKAGVIRATPERDIFFNIINRFVGLYTRESNKATRNDTSREYPFVAMDTRQVFEQIRFVKNHLNMPDEPGDGPLPTFLDIGCGIGNVLLFAEQFGFDVFGIEKDDFPFRIAARLIGENKIRREDIRTYDRYGKFDVIYYFRPFCAREPQERFERLVEERMKAGALLIANHKNSDAIKSDARFTRLHPDLPVWEKTSASGKGGAGKHPRRRP